MTANASPALVRKVQGVWREGMRCDVTAGSFHLVVDEPVEFGGTNAGPQPTDLLLASVASCFALSLAFSARKRGVALKGQTVDVTGVYEGPRFRSIQVKARLDCEPSEVEALLGAAQRVCYVTNTLKSDVPIAFSAEAVATD